MAPLKSIRKSTVTGGNENISGKTIGTRTNKALTNSNLTLKKENGKEVPLSKRKAASPIKGKETLKRSALGNITNAIELKCVINSGKKTTKKSSSSTLTKPTVATMAKLSQPASTLTKPSAGQKPQATKTMLPPIPKSRLTLPLKPVLAPVQARPSISGLSLRTVSAASMPDKPVPSEKSTTASARPSTSTVGKQTAAVRPVTRQSPRLTVKPRGMVSAAPATRRSSGRRSTLDSTDSSLYVSALSDVLDEDTAPAEKDKKPLPEPEINIDEDYIRDPFQCAVYAYEIFEYLKSREEHFRTPDYMSAVQTSLGEKERAILIDWMVEMQESFEMNHETLYLAVKLVDKYMSKVRVSKTILQLVGTTAMFIAAKYDERIPPAIEDFLYICDGSYRREDITKMEVNILRVINFELGFPLSYRFLRRYARCAKIEMPLLTLARYILEFALMDYAIVTLSDSKLAAAALYIALKMEGDKHSWDNTLIYFSGYRVEDFIDVALILNNSLHQKPKHSLQTVRTKYSHKIFYEVAKTPLIGNEDL